MVASRFYRPALSHRRHIHAGLRTPAGVWYNQAQRMSDHPVNPSSTAAACGWSFYARFYAWRFS